MPLPVRVRPVRILCAEDDADDRDLVRDALLESRFPNEVHFVKDGEELMEYLGLALDGDPNRPRPDIIFLDLWMPRKDGREALREIKANPKLRRIPVVVITTSKAEEDIVRSYDLGASSFVRKATTFDAFVEVMSTIGKYWFEVVDLPSSPEPLARATAATRTFRLIHVGAEPGTAAATLLLPSGLATFSFVEPANAVVELTRDRLIQGVVIDLDTPGGRDALPAIRTHRASLPILALSSDIFAAGSATLAGATAFLEKPHQRTDLATALANIL